MKRLFCFLIMMLGFIATSASAQSGASSGGLGGGMSGGHGSMMETNGAQKSHDSMMNHSMAQDMSQMMRHMQAMMKTMSTMMTAKTPMNHARMQEMSKAMRDISDQMNDMTEQMNMGTMDPVTNARMHERMNAMNAAMKKMQIGVQ